MVLVLAVLLSLLSGLVFVGLLTVFVGTHVVLGLTAPLRSLAPGGRLYWMMDWDEARRHPWKSRLFSFCYGWVITVGVEYLAGMTEGRWRVSLVAAVLVSLIFTWALDLWLLRK